MATVGAFLGKLKAAERLWPPCRPSLTSTFTCALDEPGSKPVETVYDSGRPAVPVMPATIGDQSALKPLLYSTAYVSVPPSASWPVQRTVSVPLTTWPVVGAVRLTVGALALTTCSART